MSDPSKPAQTTATSIVARLAAVEAAVSRIPKTGFNERQNYHYVTESDVMDCIRSTLAAQGVIIRHDVAEMKSEWRDTKSGGAMQWVSVRLTFTAHADNGETLDLGCMWGQGTDSAEKAIYKAVTGAVKYKLLKQFLMSSGDDPEAEKKPIHRERGTEQRPEPRAERPSGAPTTLPDRFGPAKGAPIHGAKMEHLESYLNAALKSVEDPTKERWKASNQALADAIGAELARQRGAVNSPKSSESSPPKKPAIVDQQEGESEEHAKQRVAGVFYAQAVRLGKDHGWEQADVGKWLKSARGRGGKGEVTEEDVAIFLRHLAPPDAPPDPPRTPGEKG